VSEHTILADAVFDRMSGIDLEFLRFDAGD
jgi:hypothetical protein